MRKLLLALLAATPFLTHAQTVTFETLTLPKPDTFYVNYSKPLQDVGYDIFFTHFPCVYDTAYGGYWVSGFAYSNKKDSVTSGYTNQYSAKPAAGHNGSNMYVVAYGQSNYIKLTGSTVNQFVRDFYITNSTYAYNSMRNGDAFAKKFGGPTGNDPDFFKMTIRAYVNKVALADSVEFYLADFRFSNNAQDYIVKDWQRVDISKFVHADSLAFTLSSSDNSTFGMNTPAYFCMDDFNDPITTGIASLPATSVAKVYPNPATDFIHIELTDASITHVSLTDISGRIVATPAVATHMTISMNGLSSGMYLLQFSSASGQSASIRITKQ